MSSGALGRGSFRSVVAGTRTHHLPTYYSCANELIALHKAHQEVVRGFYVRDKVFDNKFPGSAIANGLFKMVPNKRDNYHSREVVEAIRRRAIWIQRIEQQRRINATILAKASEGLTPDQVQDRFTFSTPDADAYFNPQSFTGANTWPNFWQHPTVNHVVPKPQWKRVPELGGITRVQDPYTTRAADY